MRRVKWKIMLPFVLLTLLFAVFATRNITELVTTSLEERVAGQLVSASRHTSDEVAKLERDHLQLVRAVSFTEGLPGAIAGGKLSATEDLVYPSAVNAGAEAVEVFDLRGERMYAVHFASDSEKSRSSFGGFAPSDWVTVYAVLAGANDAYGDKWAQTAQIDGESWLLTTGPVTDDSGRVVGAVVVGTRLQTLLRSIKKDAFADISVFSSEGQLLASTFDVADADEENGFFRGNPGHAAHGEVLGRSYQFLAADLELRGQPIGAFTVALPIEAITTTGDEARLRMAIIFATITVAVILIGWMLSRHLTGPLGRLVMAATAVSRGDLSARSNVRTGDEIGLLGISFDQMAERLERQHIATIGALASAIDARDPYTAGHSVRVGDLSAELGQDMGMPKPALHHLRVGGLLHDIGKIGVRDTILLKPGALTPDERRVIEQHPTIGLRILESAQLPREVLEIVGGHHERLNGSGYPMGLTSEEISAFPRITMVADMYDALTTNRPYRAGLSPQDALRLLWRDAENGLLDPEVVASMRRIARMWEERRAEQGLQAQAWSDSLTMLRARAQRVA